jgi:hypothetical protein
MTGITGLAEVPEKVTKRYARTVDKSSPRKLQQAKSNMKIAKYPESRGKIAIAVENKFNSYFSSECENYTLCFEDMEVNHKSLREEDVTLVLYYNPLESCDCYDGERPRGVVNRNINHGASCLTAGRFLFQRRTCKPFSPTERIEPTAVLSQQAICFTWFGSPRSYQDFLSRRED